MRGNLAGPPRAVAYCTVRLALPATGQSFRAPARRRWRIAAYGTWNAGKRDCDGISPPTATMLFDRAGETTDRGRAAKALQLMSPSHLMAHVMRDGQAIGGAADPQP